MIRDSGLRARTVPLLAVDHNAVVVRSEEG